MTNRNVKDRKSSFVRGLSEDFLKSLYNSVGNFDGCNCHELGKDVAVPIGLLKIFRMP
jgi:hypothetical protein